MDRVSTHRWEYPRSREIYTQAWKIERPRDPLFSCFCSETFARRRPFTRSLDSLSREWDRPIRLRGCRVNGQVGFDQKSLFEFGDSLKSISSFSTKNACVMYSSSISWCCSGLFLDVCAIESKLRLASILISHWITLLQAVIAKSYPILACMCCALMFDFLILFLASRWPWN